MDNSINYSKLDQAVKKALNSYEAPYNSVDWAQMETMLDVAPKQISLKKSNPQIIVVALVTIVAAFILYMLLKPSETIDTSTQMYNSELAKKAPKIKKTKPFIIHRPVAVIKDTVTVKKEAKPNTQTLTATTKVSTQTEQPAKKLNQPILSAGKKEAKNETKKGERTEEEIKKEKNTKKEEQLKRDKKIKKEAQLKKEKASKKEGKKESKTEEENEIIPLEEENDSNRNKSAFKNLVDTASSVKTSSATKSNNEKKSGKKETKRSRRDKKTNTTDSLGEKKSPSENISPDDASKNPENNKKDTIK